MLSRLIIVITIEVFRKAVSANNFTLLDVDNIEPLNKGGIAGLPLDSSVLYFTGRKGHFAVLVKKSTPLEYLIIRE